MKSFVKHKTIDNDINNGLFQLSTRESHLNILMKSFVKHTIAVLGNGPYSSFSISCLKARFDNINVNTSGMINALKTVLGLQLQ